MQTSLYKQRNVPQPVFQNLITPRVKSQMTLNVLMLTVALEAKSGGGRSSNLGHLAKYSYMATLAIMQVMRILSITKVFIETV